MHQDAHGTRTLKRNRCEKLQPASSFVFSLLDLGLALHLFRISVGAVEAYLLRDGGAGRGNAWFGLVHACFEWDQASG